MRLILIGAPGSGKTTLARRLSLHLNFSHLEADAIYWSGKKLRGEIDALTLGENWILEGHVSKHSDISFPRADKFLILTGTPLVYLYRSLKRDLLKPSRFWFNLKNHNQMESKRQELIERLKSERKEDLIYLENLSHLSESDLKTFAETLKASALKP